MDELKRFGLFLLFCLVQALVFNHIHLLGCATPLLYVLFVLLFRRNYPKWGILLWSFALGLSLNTLSNTPGVSAASLTLLGALQPYILEIFIPRDCMDDLPVGMSTLGVGKFIWFVVIMTMIYSLVFFSLEMFTFFNWMHWAECVGGSWLLTVVLILAIENVRYSW